MHRRVCSILNHTQLIFAYKLHNYSTDIYIVSVLKLSLFLNSAASRITVTSRPAVPFSNLPHHLPHDVVWLEDPHSCGFSGFSTPYYSLMIEEISITYYSRARAQ